MQQPTHLVSLFDGPITNKFPFRDCDAIELLHMIQNGEWESSVDNVRNHPDEETRKHNKTYLDYICWSGTFSERKIDGLKQHSGLICIDFDRFTKIKSKLVETLPLDKIPVLFSLLKEDKRTFAVWLSPSGNGLKALFRIDPTQHTESFDFIKQRMAEHGYTVDASGRDHSRACFVSYDPDIYINADAETLIVPAATPTEPPVTAYTTTIVDDSGWDAKKKNDYARVKRIVDFAVAHQIDLTGDYSDWIKIARCFAYFGEQGRDLFHIVSSVHPEYNAGKTDKKYDTVLKSNPVKPFHLGGFFKLAKDDYGLDIRGDENTAPRSVTTESNGVISNGVEPYKETVTKSDDGTFTYLTGEFWVITQEEGKKPAIAINYKGLAKFLARHGFKRLLMLSAVAANKYKFIRIQNNVVKPVDVQEMKDFVYEWIEANGVKDMVYEMLTRGAKNYFATDKLDRVPLEQIHFKRDSKDEAFLYFKDKYVRITKDTIEHKPYSELDGVIWASQIIDREIEFDPQCDMSKSDYFHFIQRAVTGLTLDELNALPEDKKADLIRKYDSLRTGLGYFLHSYKDKSNAKSFNIMDAVISRGKSEGRNGKSFIFEAMQRIKKGVGINGKNVDWRSNKMFAEVTLDTQFVFFNDVRKNFDFENLFHIITEGMTVIKLYENPFTFDFHESPKIGITTNFALKGEGGSFDDRQFNVELTDYFNKTRKPTTIANRLFYEGWDKEQWDLFFAFHIGCIQLYLANGLMQFPQQNIELKKFILEVGEDFFTWAENEDFSKMFEQDVTDAYREYHGGGIQVGWRYNKKMLYEGYKAYAGDEALKTTSNSFSKWMLRYAEWKGWKINAHLPRSTGEKVPRDRRNGDDFVTFTIDKEKAQQLTPAKELVRTENKQS